MTGRMSRASARPTAAKAKTWRLIFMPTVGVFRNVLRFSYDIPTGGGTASRQDQELSDDGAGGAFVTGLVAGRFTLTNVTFLAPDVNASRVLGSTLVGTYRYPLAGRFDLVTGVGMALMDVDGHYRDFEDKAERDGIVATATLDDVWVRNTVLAPFARVGVRWTIPIQHWFVGAWVGYMFETFNLRMESSGGRVYVPPPIDATKAIPALEVSHWKRYHNPLIGLEVRLDFHYAVQLRVVARYDLSHQNLAVRAWAYAFFSRDVPVGVALQLAYVEGIVHDNIYGFIGPSFLY